MTTHAGLPDFCFAIDDVNKKTILVKKGELGYYPSNKHENIDYKELNKILGVTPEQAEAMKAGSLFGWTCPASDPKFYEQEGKKIIDRLYNKVV